MVSSFLDVDAFRKRLGEKARYLTYDLTSVAGFVREIAPATDRFGVFNEIYHLASIVGPVGVLSHAGCIVESVVSDTYSMMCLAMDDGAKLCDVSTSEVYGGGRNGACSEDDVKIFPAGVTIRLEYAAAKLACEVALENAGRRFAERLSVAIIRPFNISGPRQHWSGGFVIPRFISQAMRGKPLSVYGDGKQVRAFTHVVDVARGIIAATRGPRSPAVYNLGNPHNKTTIRDLAELVIAVTGSKSTIAHVDPKTLHGPTFAEASDKYPDSDLAQRDLGWVPEYDLPHIVADAYEYMRMDRHD